MEPIVITVSFFLTVFAIVYVVFTTRNKERMAMIEKGADPKLFKSDPRAYKLSGYATFKWGLFMVGLAIGIFIGALLEQYTSLPEGAMYVSMILAFGGLGLIFAYLFRGRIERKKE